LDEMVEDKASRDVTHELEAMDGILARLRPYLLQTRAERAHAQALIKTQLDISYMLCRSLDINEALSQCLVRISHNTPYDAGAIYLLEPSGSFGLALEYKMPRHLSGRYPSFDSESYAVNFASIGDAYFGPYVTFMAMIDKTSDPERDAERQIAVLPMTSHRGTEGVLVMLSEDEFDCDVALRNALSSISSNMASTIARIRTMHALRESSVQLQLMSDHASEGIAITDKGIVVRANRTLSNWLGLDGEAIQGEPISRFIRCVNGQSYNLVGFSGAVLHPARCEVHHLNRVNGYEDCSVWVVRVTSPEG